MEIIQIFKIIGVFILGLGFAIGGFLLFTMIAAFFGVELFSFF